MSKAYIISFIVWPRSNYKLEAGSRGWLSETQQAGQKENSKKQERLYVLAVCHGCKHACIDNHVIPPARCSHRREWKKNKDAEETADEGGKVETEGAMPCSIVLEWIIIISYSALEIMSGLTTNTPNVHTPVEARHKQILCLPSRENYRIQCLENLIY